MARGPPGGGFVPLVAVYDEWAALAVCAAAAAWAVPHLQLWLLPSLPTGAAALLLAGAALGVLGCVAVLAALLYVLTVPAADPSAPREAHAAGRRAAAAATGTLGAPPAGATLAAAAPAAAASFGPLLRAQERYAGRVWTVLPHDWLPGAPPDEFPPRSCGPGAAAHQWSARLRGGALRLTLDGEGAAGQVAKVRVKLAGCAVRVASECLRGGKGPWWRKGPLEVRHLGGAPLLGGCSSFYLLAPDGASKEQWHSALLWACGAGGEVQRTGALYSTFCDNARQQLAAIAAPDGGAGAGGDGWRDLEPPRLSRRALMRPPRDTACSSGPCGGAASGACSGAASPCGRSAAASPAGRSFARRRVTGAAAQGATGDGDISAELWTRLSPATATAAARELALRAGPSSLDVLGTGVVGIPSYSGFESAGTAGASLAGGAGGARGSGAGRPATPRPTVEGDRDAAAGGGGGGAAEGAAAEAGGGGARGGGLESCGAPAVEPGRGPEGAAPVQAPLARCPPSGDCAVFVEVPAGGALKQQPPLPAPAPAAARPTGAGGAGGAGGAHPSLRSTDSRGVVWQGEAPLDGGEERWQDGEPGPRPGPPAPLAARASPPPQQQQRAPPPPPLAGANALLVRVAFELLRSRELQARLAASLQRRLADIKRPPYLGPLELVALDLGSASPVLTGLRAASCPLARRAGGGAAPQLQLQVAYEGCVSVVVRTRVDPGCVQEPPLQQHSPAAAQEAGARQQQPSRSPSPAAAGAGSAAGAPGGGPPPLGTTPAAAAAASWHAQEDAEDATDCAMHDAVATSLREHRRQAAAAGAAGAAGAAAGPLPMVGRVLSGVPFLGKSGRAAAAAGKRAADVAAAAAAAAAAGLAAGVGLELRVCLTRLEGSLIMWLPPPPSDRLWLSFLSPPKVELSVRPAVAGRALRENLRIARCVSSWIEGRLMRALTSSLRFPSAMDVRMPLFAPAAPPPAETPPNEPAEHAPRAPFEGPRRGEGAYDGAAGARAWRPGVRGETAVVAAAAAGSVSVRQAHRELDLPEWEDAGCLEGEEGEEWGRGSSSCTPSSAGACAGDVCAEGGGRRGSSSGGSSDEERCGDRHSATGGGGGGSGGGGGGAGAWAIQPGSTRPAGQGLSVQAKREPKQSMMGHAPLLTPDARRAASLSGVGAALLAGASGTGWRGSGAGAGAGAEGQPPGRRLPPLPSGERGWQLPEEEDGHAAPAAAAAASPPPAAPLQPLPPVQLEDWAAGSAAGSSECCGGGGGGSEPGAGGGRWGGRGAKPLEGRLFSGKFTWLRRKKSRSAKRLIQELEESRSRSMDAAAWQHSLGAGPRAAPPPAAAAASRPRVAWGTGAESDGWSSAAGGGDGAGGSEGAAARGRGGGDDLAAPEGSAASSPVLGRAGLFERALSGLGAVAVPSDSESSSHAGGSAPRRWAHALSTGAGPGAPARPAGVVPALLGRALSLKPGGAKAKASCGAGAPSVGTEGCGGSPAGAEAHAAAPRPERPSSRGSGGGASPRSAVSGVGSRGGGGLRAKVGSLFRAASNADAIASAAGRVSPGPLAALFGGSKAKEAAAAAGAAAHAASGGGGAQQPLQRALSAGREVEGAVAAWLAASTAGDSPTAPCATSAEGTRARGHGRARTWGGPGAGGGAAEWDALDGGGGPEGPKAAETAGEPWPPALAAALGEGRLCGEERSLPAGPGESAAEPEGASDSALLRRRLSRRQQRPEAAGDGPWGGEAAAAAAGGGGGFFVSPILTPQMAADAAAAAGGAPSLCTWQDAAARGAQAVPAAGAPGAARDAARSAAIGGGGGGSGHGSRGHRRTSTGSGGSINLGLHRAAQAEAREGDDWGESRTPNLAAWAQARGRGGPL